MNDRIAALAAFGDLLRQLSHEELDALGQRAQSQNPWFTPENVRLSLEGMSHILRTEVLSRGSAKIPSVVSPRRVGLLADDAVPGAVFEDVIRVLLEGHAPLLRLHPRDTVVPHFLLERLGNAAPELAGRARIVQHFKEAEALLATSEPGIARQLERYFRHVPHLIRPPRASLAVLDGQESLEQLGQLANAMLRFFGRSPRSVKKLLVPADYDFTPLTEALQPWQALQHHHHYANYGEYNRSVYLLKKIPYVEAGALAFVADARLLAPVGSVFYEEYDNQASLLHLIEQHAGERYAVLSARKETVNTILFSDLWRPVAEIAPSADNPAPMFKHLSCL